VDRPRFRHISGKVLPIADRSVIDHLPPHHLDTCFGCGPLNEARLGIHPRYEGDLVVAEIEFHPRFEGGPGLAHGGAIAAFFDDLIGFVSMAHQRPAVTAKLEVNYLRPIPLGVTIRGEAWLAGDDGRKLYAEAVGFGPGGVVHVEVAGLFIEVGIEHFTKALEGPTPYPVSMYRSDEYYP
jgi:acyl-coenzyme A thioesterase PaaI-like protein